MSEKTNHREHLKPGHTPEHRPTAEHHGHAKNEKLHHRHEHKENLDEIQRSIEAHSKKSAETRAKHSPEATSEPSEAFVNKELKVMAFNRTMARVRRQLSPANRAFSRFVHSSPVDMASSALDKTVARPSAILGGGILAALGGMVYYFIARKYGYDYNATVLLVLFAGGYLAGLFIDLVRKLASPR